MSKIRFNEVLGSSLHNGLRTPWQLGLTEMAREHVDFYGARHRGVYEHWMRVTRDTVLWMATGQMLDLTRTTEGIQERCVLGERLHLRDVGNPTHGFPQPPRMQKPLACALRIMDTFGRADIRRNAVYNAVNILFLREIHESTQAALFR